MVQFVDVDPEDIPNVREGRRGRVSYPILKSFLETGKYVAMLDRTGMQQSFQSLYSSLTAYIRSHNLPIKIFSRRNQIYLMRLDIDADGNPIENWQDVATTEGHLATEVDLPPVEITSEEVAKRFEQERKQVTK